MKKLLMLMAALIAIHLKQPVFAQDELPSNLPMMGSCTGIPAVYVNCASGGGGMGVDPVVLEDEWDIVNTLCYYKSNVSCLCNFPQTLYFSPNKTYDMGLIPVDYFPIEVPPGIILEGDYDIGNVSPQNTSNGTHIIFPYLYEGGYSNYTQNLFGLCYTYDNQAAVFKLFNGAQIHHVSFEGVVKDKRDFSWYYWDQNACSPSQHLPASMGLSSGILVVGNKCEISHCEFTGFSMAGVIVRDMIVTNAAGVVTTPSNCYTIPTAPNTNYGEFTFHHNYVHNNKIYGYGYGLWVSSSSSTTAQCMPPILCDFDDAKQFYNFVCPEEKAEIYNNVFLDNKHDIASTGQRISLDIYDNSFSGRNAAPNINMHNSVGWTCNPLASDGPSHRMSGTNTFNPNQNIFKSVGGSVTKIHENAFHSQGSGIQLPYPNTNECTNNLGYPLEFARIEIDDNYFTTSDQHKAANGTNLFWPDPLNAGMQDGYYKIEIGKTPYYNYLFYGPFPTGDDHLQINESATLGNNVVESAPLPPTSITPVAAIASTIQSSGLPADDSPKLIQQGDIILFDTHLCQDVDRNLPPTHPMLNMWRFGDTSTPYNDIRTDNSNISNAIAHQFTEVGVCNVVLMDIDVDNSLPLNKQFHASNLVQQQITVKPKGGIYFTFNIKDSYVGMHLTPHSYTYNATTITHGVYDAETDLPDMTETRFVKYAAINGTILWQDDIAGDEGWQHVEILLGHGFPVGGFDKGEVEIGLMAVTDALGHGPDASIVKGITVYVDDAYINNPDGTNALGNGDFETRNTYPHDPHDPGDDYPAVWEALDETDNNMSTLDLTQYTNQCAPTGTFNINNKGSKLSSEDVHSGLLAYKGWVRPFNNDYYHPTSSTPDAQYETGRFYNAPGRYKGVIQRNYQWNAPMRHGAFTLYVMPNPGISGSKVNVYCSGYENQNKILTVYSAQGNEAVRAAFDGEHYALNTNLKPGVYIVTVECQGWQEKKKLVITN